MFFIMQRGLGATIIRRFSSAIYELGLEDCPDGCSSSKATSL